MFELPLKISSANLDADHNFNVSSYIVFIDKFLTWEIPCIYSFPTIYWAPKNGKDNPEKYQGGREVSDFVDFIKRKASDPIEFPEDGKKKSQKDDEAL